MNLWRPHTFRTPGYLHTASRPAGPASSWHRSTVAPRKTGTKAFLHCLATPRNKRSSCWGRLPLEELFTQQHDCDLCGPDGCFHGLRGMLAAAQADLVHEAPQAKGKHSIAQHARKLLVLASMAGDCVPHPRYLVGAAGAISYSSAQSNCDSDLCRRTTMLMLVLTPFEVTCCSKMEYRHGWLPCDHPSCDTSKSLYSYKQPHVTQEHPAWVTPQLSPESKHKPGLPALLPAAPTPAPKLF